MVPQGMTVTQYSLLSQLRGLDGQSLSQIAARFSVEAMVEATERVLAETVPGSAA